MPISLPLDSASAIILQGEGQLFQTYLGDAWTTLSPNIKSRFSHPPLPDAPIRYQGTMTLVRCSKLGKLLARLVQYTGALLPYEGANIPVEIEVSARANQHGVYKRRVYHFPAKKPFAFRSRMLMSPKGELLEYVGGGFGMRIHIEAKDGNLHFYDRGYFFAIGPWRIPLPALFTPGDTYLLHEDTGPHSFKIIIRIRHRLYGEMYYQEGVFEHAI